MKLSKKIFYCLGCVFATANIFTILPLKATIMPKNNQNLTVISSIDVYKNTTLLDTNQQMIALHGFLPTYYTDFKYATVDNFTGKILYSHPKAYLRLPVARAVYDAINLLKSRGLTLKIYDAYRPYAVTIAMWKVVPDSRYAADPARGSGHNRGGAVDVTLVDINSGKECEMPTSFDDFSEKAHHRYSHLSKKVIINRALLKAVMEEVGFESLETEWWHYSFKGSSQKFDLLDLSFEDLNNQ